MHPVTAKCKDLEILQSRLRADLKIYKESMVRLEFDTAAKDFQDSYARAEHARLAFRMARKRLNDHIAEHGCLDVPI